MGTCTLLQSSFWFLSVKCGVKGCHHDLRLGMRRALLQLQRMALRVALGMALSLSN